MAWNTLPHTRRTSRRNCRCEESFRRTKEKAGYPDAIAAILTKILKALGLERTRFHALRHTFASAALQNGVDIRTVSGMLEHADPGFTLRAYTHTMNTMQERAAETMGDVMARNL